eukprot:3940310-Rhodomonas_salina.2
MELQYAGLLCISLSLLCVLSPAAVQPALSESQPPLPCCAHVVQLTCLSRDPPSHVMCSTSGDCQLQTRTARHVLSHAMMWCVCSSKARD